MTEALVGKALSTTDSIFLVLLLILGVGFAGLLRSTLKTNNDREKRYIKVIEVQAKGLQAVDDLRKDVHDIKSIIMQREGQ